MLRRLALALLSLVLLAVLAAAGLVALVAWRPDLAKGQIERLASGRLGLPVTIEGPLAVDLGRVSTVEAAGLRVAAPAWAEADTLAAIRRLRAGLDLGRWWQDGSLVLTELLLDQPQIALERDAQGRTSWPGGSGDSAGQSTPSSGETAPTLPEIHDLTITDGRVSYADAVTGVAIETSVATAQPQPGAARAFGGLELDGRGQVRGDEVTFALEVGSPVLLTQAGAPFPIRGELGLAGTRLRLDGGAANPLALEGLNLALDLASPDPSKLLALLGQPVENAPPDLAVRGRLARQQGVLALTGLEARWAESRLDGELSYDPTAERPRLNGRLHSALLDLVALRPVLSARQPQPREAEQPAGSDGESPSPLAAYDGRLALSVDRLRVPDLELRDIAAELALTQGRLVAEPLRVGFPEGALTGRVEVADLAEVPLAARVDLKAENVDLAPLAALAALDQRLAGKLTGTLAGTARGTEARTLLAESELTFQGSLAGLAYGPYATREAGFTAELAGGELTLDPVRLVMPRGSLDGRVTVRHLVASEAPAATVDLRAEALDLAPFLVPALVPEDRNLAGRFTGTLAGTLRGATPEAILAESEVTLEGAFDGLRYTDLAAREASLNAKLAKGSLTLDPIRLVLPEGGVSGRIATGPLDQALTSEINLTGTGVDLAAVLGSDSGVAGILSGELKGVVRGETPAELLARSQLGFNGTIERPQVPRLAGELGTLTLSASLQAEGERPLLVTAEGTLGGAPLRIEARGRDLPVLLAGKGALPVSLEMTLGESRAGASGTLGLPLDAGRLDLALSLQGPNPGPILALLEMPAIELPPYSLAGDLSRRGQSFTFKNIKGKVGDSDLGGTLQLTLDGPRPKISGDLRSALLDIDDLGGLIGAEPATGPGETASRGQQAEAAAEERDREVLPDEQFDPARWRQLDADVRLRAGEVRAGRIPLDAFELHTVLDAGRLRVEPLVLRLGEGRVEGWLQLDARKAPGAANLDLDMQRLPMSRLLNRLEVDTSSFGTLSGRARGGVAVGGEGLSIKQILSNGDGEVSLLMEGGTLNRQLVTALGFDLLRLFGSILGAAPQEVRFTCALADLVLRNGVIETRSLAIDTAVADIAGEGTIDLRSERIDIALLANPEGVAVPGGRTGISIGGTLADPQIQVNAGRLLARGAAAGTFGLLLSPLTGLASQLGIGGQAQGPCSGLLEEVPDRGNQQIEVR